MKKQFILACLISFVLCSCNSDSAWNCLQTVGNIVEVPFEVEPFTRITVEDDIFLEIEKGDDYQVVVTTGSNLLNDISVVVEPDGNLRLKNNIGCNLAREYDVTYVKVVTPVLTAIRSASRNPVRSLNTLAFEELELQSNTNPGVIDAGKSGDFILDVEVDKLTVRANGFSVFTISGTANIGAIRFFDELPRFEGAQLIVQNLKISHVSGNDMIVNPQASIEGFIRSTGDVISLNKPPLVDVQEFYTGRLIFQ